MAQAVRTFYDLGGPMYMADPRVAEAQAQQRLALEQQRIRLGGLQALQAQQAQQLAREQAQQRQQNFASDLAFRQAEAERGAADRQQAFELQRAGMSQAREESALDRALRESMQQRGLGAQAQEAAAGREFAAGQSEAERNLRLALQQAGFSEANIQGFMDREFRADEAERGREFERGMVREQREFEAGQLSLAEQRQLGQDVSETLLPVVQSIVTEGALTEEAIGNLQAAQVLLAGKYGQEAANREMERLLASPQIANAIRATAGGRWLSGRAPWAPSGSQAYGEYLGDLERTMSPQFLDSPERPGWIERWLRSVHGVPYEPHPITGGQPNVLSADELGALIQGGGQLNPRLAGPAGPGPQLQAVFDRLNQQTWPQGFQPRSRVPRRVP